MPQSSDEMRAKWGGIGGVGEDKATEFLESKGYALREDWVWVPPVNHVPTEEEQEAARFLVEEWDYGWIEFKSECTIQEYVQNKLPCDKCGGDKASRHQRSCPITTNPVHQHKDNSWWFYDEIWADEYGPFDNEESAERWCAKYAKEMLGLND